jgi:signal transduction histidine kinase/ActR/RegA family two-component response regulator
LLNHYDTVVTPSAPRTAARAGPLRTRLLLLAASGLVPLALVLAWGINHLIEERSSATERSVLELSRALATAVDAEQRSVIALLNQVTTSDDLERADLRAFYFTARRTAEQFGWRQISLADPEGRTLLRTNQPFGEASPQAVEPESLKQVIANKTPAIGRVVETPQQPSDTFAVRVPVIRGGQLVYVLTGVLSTDAMSAVLTRQNIPQASVASVFDQVGHRAARSVKVDSPYASPSLQALLDRGGSQGAGRTTTREGVDNYTGFTRLPDSGWVVVVGSSIAEANKALYTLLGAVAMGLAASVGLAILLAWILSRRILEPIEQLKQGAADLGRGAPVDVPPLAIVELDDVAVALNDAAADRDRSAARVNEALHMAEDANRSKDQFLAMLGHELRNPLAPIATAVQIMGLKGDETTAAERRIIERQLVHVTRLVDDLLDVSRITSGRLAIRREPVRIAQVLGQVIDNIRPSLFQRTLTYEPNPNLDAAWVAGDEVRLAQVFNNLLVNAIKFTSAGQSVRVAAAVESGEVRIDVQDTGTGIPAGEIDKIFDLFYQAPQSFDRARGGLGLGLPIVRSLVEMHSGAVQATSAGPGEGSRFTVRLPLCEPPEATADAEPAQAMQGAGNVLVVDDNEDAADTCATLLEIAGYTVRVAYTPEAALETLRDFTPQVAILDIGLPRMSGYTLAGLMKDAPANYLGALVALTGYGQAADMAASQAAGFDAHLTKPVNPGELLELLVRLSNRNVSSSAGTPS